MFTSCHSKLFSLVLMASTASLNGVVASFLILYHLTVLQLLSDSYKGYQQKFVQELQPSVETFLTYSITI